ncbi:universal stress protein [Lysobacter sp. TY2-98]|uniref:universal stress protein n=1 Tax=Lysobacter sp. TY2-98 TaxID=2290922 RepID=UPI000E2038B8|nr:universal stress protein [Lysobacter sp. TY2-98]AXK72239.1 universal stress protein [Lysobacter sp. TY2-98]
MHDVLVRSRTIDDWDAGVRAAARIAAMLRGGLTAVHVVPVGLPPLSPYDLGMLVAAAALEVARQRHECEARVDAFDAWATSLGVRGPAWLSCAGDAARALRYLAGSHDLLVAWLDPASDDPWDSPAGVGRLASATGLPTIVLPSDASDELKLDTVVVGWNGSPCAAAALHAARPFVQRATRVVVLDGAGAPSEPTLPTIDLHRWLTRHCADAEVHPIEAGDGGEGTGAELLAAARRLNADLLVMGAYGHARLTEWALGGVTRHVLGHTDLPLLLRHER